MSDHDEALLDEDLGDEVYDLGNDEEEALLADDEIDNERLPVQQSYSSKADEETDDVLDLGVTDAFDDLVTEDENVQSKTKSHVEVNICQKNDIPNELSSNELRKNQTQAKPEAVKNTTKYESIGERGRQQNHSDEEPSVKQKSDLREKLKERNNFHKHNQATDDEDGEELKERRNRFQSERTVVPTKANQEIPDSLEKVVTSDQHIKAHNRRERDKNRDRSERFERRTLSNRPGGRYDPHLPIRYHHGPLPPTPGAMHYRPENRSFQCGNSASGPLPLPVSSLGQPRHSMYPPIPSYHHPQNSGSHPHYNDPQLPMLPNQYPEPMQPSQLPSLVPGPLIDYRSRGPAPPPPGVGPAPATYGLAPLTFPPVPYSQHMTEHSSVQVMTGNQASLPLPSHRPSTYDSRMTNSYESGYEMRSKPPANFGQTQTPIGVPYSSQSLQQCRQQSQPPVTATPQEVSSSQKLLVTPSVNSISNVPVIPTGHKILINPHFKGKIDNKTLHDPAETFVQALRNASNSSSREGRSSSHQAKSDDPFSYFSDMWQESKSQRVQNSHSHRSYSPENNYSKSSSHDKFKSDLQWSHKNEHLETSSKKNYDSRDYNEHKKSRDVYRDKDREREKDRDKDKERKREKELSPKTKSDVTDSLLKNSHKIDDHDNLVNKPVHEEKKKFSHHSGKETVRTVVKRTSDTSIDKFTVDKVAKKLKIPQKHSSNKNVEENIQKQEEEELDPEMKEYRMKMEEQKRLREKIILEKENRRKLAAMEKNKSEHSNHSNEIEKARVQLTIVSTEKEIKKGKTNLSAAKTFESLTNVHSSEESTFGFQSLNEMKKYRKKKLSNVSETEQKSMEESKGEIEKIIESDQESDDDTDESDTAMREFIEKDSDKSDEDDGGKSKLLSRIVLGRNKRVLKSKLDQSSIIQKPTVNAHRQLGQIRKLLANPQRIVVSAASKIHQKNNAGTISQRNIVHKSEAKKLLKSNIVRVDNLAATTTEHQIRKMCQGIGSIESIQMGEGNATIIFKTQSAAMVFHKKYQRKMLDLSLIKVQLISQIAMSKNSSKH